MDSKEREALKFVLGFLGLCVGAVVVWAIVSPLLSWLWTEIVLPLLALLLILFIKCLPFAILLGILKAVFGKEKGEKIYWLVALFSIFKRK